jgi:hypothetical protein
MIHSELRRVRVVQVGGSAYFVPHVHSPALHWQLLHCQQAGWEQLDGQHSRFTAGARIVAAVVRIDGVRIELRENVCVRSSYDKASEVGYTRRSWLLVDGIQEERTRGISSSQLTI